MKKLCRTRAVYVWSCWKKIDRPLGGAVTLLRSSVVRQSIHNAGSAQDGESVFPVLSAKARGVSSVIITTRDSSQKHEPVLKKTSVSV